MQLNNKNTKEYLNAFAKYVIQQSRSNLTKQNKNVDKKLYDSLDKEIEVGANSFRMAFLMEDYGAYQDKGVSGTQKKYNTPFSYKSKKPPLKPITQWVTKRRFQFRNKETGKFMSYQSTAFLVRNGIFKNGIKPSLFFTKPFEKAFERLPDELIEAYGLDVEQFLEFTINKK
jgi:hypothetical protein